MSIANRLRDLRDAIQRSQETTDSEFLVTIVDIVGDLARELDELKSDHRRSAQLASQLANGIIPD